MGKIDKLYDWLAQGPTPDFDRILGCGLEIGGTDSGQRVIHCLLERGYEASWAALIGQYGLLEPTDRERLHESEERMRAGIALAMRSASHDVRLNALQAMGALQSVRLTYLLPDALRDPSAKISLAAARVLQETTAHFLDQPVPAAPDAGQEEINAYRSRRRELVQALREAWRTFDLHRRIEVLQTCLWLARDCADSIWADLTKARSRPRHVVTEYLGSWDDPRLAGFLLTALKQIAWRPVALKMLARWGSTAQMTALLRETDLLDDVEIRRNVAGIKSTVWLDELGRELGALPVELRPEVPRWVCCLGLNTRRKSAYLKRWVGSHTEKLHRASVYALATLETTDADDILERVAGSASPIAGFARWYVWARHTGLVRSRRIAKRQPVEEDLPLAPAAAEAPLMPRLWQVCRRTSPELRAEAIEIIRADESAWRLSLKRYLQSPDPRDRGLVLEIIGRSARARQYREELLILRDDSVDAIRRLAKLLLLVVASNARAGADAARDHGDASQSMQDFYVAEMVDVWNELEALLRPAHPSAGTHAEDQNVLREARAKIRSKCGAGDNAALVAEATT